MDPKMTTPSKCNEWIPKNDDFSENVLYPAASPINYTVTIFGGYGIYSSKISFRKKNTKRTIPSSFPDLGVATITYARRSRL